MSDTAHNLRASARMAHSSGVVHRAIPPLPQLESRQKCPRFASNSQHLINPNLLHPHVSAANRFTSWLSPYGIASMNVELSRFPPEIIIHRRLVMARCVLPNTLKNYAAGLSCFTKFCDNFSIPEIECMPASELLLSTFITSHGAGSVGKGAIKTWLLGIELWHHINNAPWLGGAVLKHAVEGLAKLAPASSRLDKHNPVTIEHLCCLRHHLDLTDSFDIAVFTVMCIAFWCCCR